MRKAIIIGAGPAGLTAAYELLRQTDIKPIIFEMSQHIGGISKTINYKGNRIDIGGHRFFSKSEIVMNWWNQFLPIQKTTNDLGKSTELTYHKKKTEIFSVNDGPDPDHTDKVMLIRKRLSRIYFLRKFFNYPVSFNVSTLKNLGLTRVLKILISYAYVKLFRIKHEQSLEDFFINRFGKELYLTFFKDYTEKVWGVPCSEISPEWGAQRIKGLSVKKTIQHAITSAFSSKNDIAQKLTETSLIEQFLYPKFGPGQMWEEVANQVNEKGGEVKLNNKVIRVLRKDCTISGIEILDEVTQEKMIYKGEYYLSTMAIKDLVMAFDPPAPDDIRTIAEGLVYRDFITVGLLLNKLKIVDVDKNGSIGKIKDNWIYIQEPDVKIGRLQIFNNWSPYMVKDPVNTVWIGLEYFCNDNDTLWQMSDTDFTRFAIEELEKIGLIDKMDVLDSTLIRMPKTYPAYFGTYSQFGKIRDYLDSFCNLYLIGRNGMHKYNNADHSMLTAMMAVDNIATGSADKSRIWEINTEENYHERK